MSALGDVIGEAAREVAEHTVGAIDQLVNQAAVKLMNGVLPAMVHAHNTAVKSGGWVAVEASSAAVQFALGSASTSNGVLAGMVAQKVDHAVAQLSSENHYDRGVNSIS